MFTVRVILALIGVALIAGIYLWGTAKSRRRQRLSFRNTYRERSTARRLAGPQDDVDHLDFAESLSPPDAAALEQAPPEDGGPPLYSRHEAPRASPGAQMELGIAPGGEAGRSAAPHEREMVIVLYLEGEPGRHFTGPQIRTAMAAADLEFGEMGIYNHYGAGQTRTQRPVFSIANMFEPGRFDPAAMPQFRTAGLAMFMRLPAPVPIDGQVAFELMLATAKLLAKQLSARLNGEDHRPLDARAIERLRASVTAFERALV
jgi:cell division protein ZipA